MATLPCIGSDGRMLPFSRFLIALSVLGSVGVTSLLPPDGRGAGHRQALDAHFVTAQTCARCHSAAETATALWSATGDDVSPHGLWKATMMANAYRDPYWQAQVRKEVAAAESPEAAEKVEALCITCHGPAVHHTARLDEGASPGVFASAEDALARDGVTCTVCHQAQADGLGEASSFSGNLTIGTEKQIFGPYEDPSARPMLMHTGYTATHGPHVREAALCGSCHTLYTHHQADSEAFPEQTPYLEWRNSIFSDEGGTTETSRTCQQCHMPELGPMRIARNPAGRDFNIPVRDEYRGHAFVGGNAFMLDLLRANAEELGVEASPEALERGARATRRQLAHETAELKVDGLKLEDGRASFAVHVTNRTGHKLPTGYPARRAWLRVQVRYGRKVVFESGGYDEQGRIRGLEDPFLEPHHDRIESSDQVQVYEMVAADADGRPTTHLTRMASLRKDNRLLPAGWQPDGPHAGDTTPIGIGDAETDFTDGADVVHFDVPLPEDTPQGRPVVVAWLLYQPVPPHWVDALREVDGDEPARFVRMYDAADKTPETLGVTVAVGGG